MSRIFLQFYGFFFHKINIKLLEVENQCITKFTGPKNERGIKLTRKRPKSVNSMLR